MRDSGRRTIVLLAAVLPWLCAGAARAHFFVSPLDRVSASPATPGTGWSAAVYLDIPDNFASSLLSAETYVASRAPDFTFHADYVDFPAGPQDSLLETDVPDMGTLLGSAATDVSDPAALAHPLGNFLIRFTGLVNVRPEVNALDIPGLPVLLDFGTQGYGGYRLRVGTTSIYRVQNHVFNGDNPFYSENALVHGFGLFPIQVTYFNRYDPTGAEGHERVGVELYSFYAGGLPWPAGTVINNPVFGPMTVTPPSAIYQPQDVPALARGDADGDGSITLADYAALQRCAGGIALDDACAVMDLDGDGTMGDFDVHWFTQLLAGPGAYPLLPGDYNADNRVDLADYRWFQWCVQPGGGDDRAGLKVGCEAFDVDANARIDAADYAVFQRFVFGPDAGP